MHYRLARLPKWARTLLDALVSGGVPLETLRDARSRLAAFPGRPRHVIGVGQPTMAASTARLALPVYLLAMTTRLS